jgi:hypothetical protein
VDLESKLSERVMFVVMCSKPSGVVGIQCNRTGKKADLWVYIEKNMVYVYKKRIKKVSYVEKKDVCFF